MIGDDLEQHLLELDECQAEDESEELARTAFNDSPDFK